LIGKRYFEHLERADVLSPANGLFPEVTGKKPVFVMLSQSGETADLIHCVKNVKQMNHPLITVTNTKGSTLDRKPISPCCFSPGSKSPCLDQSLRCPSGTLGPLAGALKPDHQVIGDLYGLIEVLKTIIVMKRSLRESPHSSLRNNTLSSGAGYDYDVSWKPR
jgi:hypothetical protein